MPEKYRRRHHHERVQVVERKQRAWEAEGDAVAIVHRFNAGRATTSKTLLAEHILKTAAKGERNPGLLIDAALMAVAA